MNTQKEYINDMDSSLVKDKENTLPNEGTEETKHKYRIIVTNMSISRTLC